MRFNSQLGMPPRKKAKPTRSDPPVSAWLLFSYSCEPGHVYAAPVTLQAFGDDQDWREVTFTLLSAPAGETRTGQRQAEEKSQRVTAMAVSTAKDLSDEDAAKLSTEARAAGEALPVLYTRAGETVEHAVKISAPAVCGLSCAYMQRHKTSDCGMSTVFASEGSRRKLTTRLMSAFDGTRIYIA